MVDVDEVIDFQGLKPINLGYDKEDTEALCEVVTKWICQSESLIKSYTNNPFTDEVPEAVKNVCLRLTSNMISLAIQRRDSPIIKVNDWQIRTVSSEIFTDDLKKDLIPFIIDHSTISDTIDIFAITGEDLE